MYASVSDAVISMDDDSLSYVRLTPDHIDSLSDLCHECFPVHYSRENILTMLHDVKVYTAGFVAHGKVVGCVMGATKMFASVSQEVLGFLTGFAIGERFQQIAFQRKGFLSHVIGGHRILPEKVFR